MSLPQLVIDRVCHNLLSIEYILNLSYFQRLREQQHPRQSALSYGTVRDEFGNFGGGTYGGLSGGETQVRGTSVSIVTKVNILLCLFEEKRLYLYRFFFLLGPLHLS